METVLTAIIAFSATNIDDIFILTLFFSETDSSFRERHIVFGQYLGFMTLILVSLLGFLGTFVIPQQWLGFLGLAPIVIGIRKLFGRSSREEENKDVTSQLEEVSQPSWLSGFLRPAPYTVATVTIANGGDNLGIYTPLFANSNVPDLLIIIGTFLVMVAVWCFAGYRLTRQRGVARLVSKHGHVLVPLVLIALGVYILMENGALALLH